MVSVSVVSSRVASSGPSVSMSVAMETAGVDLQERTHFSTFFMYPVCVREHVLVCENLMSRPTVCVCQWSVSLCPFCVCASGVYLCVLFVCVSVECIFVSFLCVCQWSASLCPFCVCVCVHSCVVPGAHGCALVYHLKALHNTY